MPYKGKFLLFNCQFFSVESKRKVKRPKSVLLGRFSWTRL
ncbi:hypothetical protein SGRA_2072 [Saprospira grandis str. Lewin]|uniref:Uncharacterized protein n=1 Tax=Saprospira grandis (strain Lewin) TaxID=984262 RepID=H6L2P6_SAPGL|nr:hypothetical protein SGRA_2072 [Saprospira grandis str. Lewin]